MGVRKVLVVGCGYIGLPLARYAQTADAMVYATTRRPERFADLHGFGFHPVQWDVLGDNADPLPQVDAVVYTVGFDREAGRPMRDVYVEGLVRTLAALPGRPKVVYASSTGVYGNARGAFVDETWNPSPTDESGENCLLAELALARFGRERDVPFCILRFAGLYGLGRLIGGEALRRGEPVRGDGAAWLNLVHQEDVALALWKAIELGQPGEIYNIADGRPVRRAEFYSKLAELLDAPPPVFAPELARRQRGNRRINADKARWKLAWAPRYPSYVEGLEAIVREMRRLTSKSSGEA